MGYPADERMMFHAAKRNIELTSKSRPLKPQDMVDYDYIIGMDSDNVAQIQLAADYWIVNMPEKVPRDYRNKVPVLESLVFPALGIAYSRLVQSFQWTITLFNHSDQHSHSPFAPSI